MTDNKPPVDLSLTDLVLWIAEREVTAWQWPDMREWDVELLRGWKS